MYFTVSFKLLVNSLRFFLHVQIIIKRDICYTYTNNANRGVDFIHMENANKRNKRTIYSILMFTQCDANMKKEEEKWCLDYKKCAKNTLN